MKHLWMGSLLAAMALHGADSVESWFKEGKAHGNIKYYYISTTKDGGTPGHSSAHSNAIGGQLGYETGSLYGLKAAATFMTTNPFAIPNDPRNVETSTLARDNGMRLDGSATGVHADDGFSVLGEAYAQYNRDNYDIWYGRKVIDTPLMDAKEVRMVPSAFQGGMATLKADSALSLSVGYLDKFKQRTSDRFIDIIEHALGTNTVAITGGHSGSVIPLSAEYKKGPIKAVVYDDYAKDFMNSIYAEASYGSKLDNGISYSTSVQGMMQDGVGNAQSAAAQAIMGGKINAQALGAKVSMSIDKTTIMAACTHVFSNSGDHDSLVLPWDGTPLYTNTITSNDLFVSDYGQGLTSDSAYIGGTTGYKVGVNQKFDIAGMEGFSAGASYAHYDNNRFASDQDDINGELGYGAGKFSLALKGIWVNDNTSAKINNTLNAQNEKFTQYRVIANYKF